MKKIVHYILVSFLIFSLFLAGGSPVLAQDIPSAFGMEELDTLLKDNKGKIIMLNFFASWCPPCKEEVPDLVTLRKHFTEDSVLFIGISLDEDLEALQVFSKANKINYPVYIGKADIQQYFDISGIPHNVLYDIKGEIVVNTVGIVPKRVIQESIAKLLEGAVS